MSGDEALRACIRDLCKMSDLAHSSFTWAGRWKRLARKCWNLAQRSIDTARLVQNQATTEHKLLIQAMEDREIIFDELQECYGRIEHLERGIELLEKVRESIGHRHHCIDAESCDWCRWVAKQEKQREETHNVNS